MYFAGMNCLLRSTNKFMVSYDHALFFTKTEYYHKLCITSVLDKDQCVNYAINSRHYIINP